MRVEKIIEEYSKQLVQTKDSGLVNIFKQEEFKNICEVMYEECALKYTNIMDYSEDEFVIVFYNIHSKTTVYRSLVSLLSKSNKMVYLDDICISLFTRDNISFNTSRDRHILKPNGSPLSKRPLTINLFSEIGKDLLRETIQYNVSDTTKSQEINLIDELQQRIQGGNTSSDSTPTIPPTNQQTQPSESQFLVNNSNPSLTEQAKEVGQKVKSVVDSVATVADKFLSKNTVYIINEKQLLREGADLSLFHIYLNRKLVTTVLPSEFPIVILALIKNGPIEIKEVEFVTSLKDEWTPPEKI